MVAQSGKRRGVGWSIAVGWLLLVVAFGGAFIALIGWAQEGKTASPAAPYWERLFPLAIVSVVLALLFAAWVSDAAWTPAFRARRAFVLFGASVAVLFGVGLAAAGLLPRLEYNALSNLPGGYPTPGVGADLAASTDWRTSRSSSRTSARSTAAA